ncbi:MAG: arginase family protein [Bacteroidales bacterium]|nr:arginase family protein [Bacteroidales bacterium]
MPTLQEILLYFDPVGPIAYHTDERILNPLSEATEIYRNNGNMPDIGQAKIVLAGVGNPQLADEIRSYLYGLTAVLPKGDLVDLGNLRQGKTPADTQIGLGDVITELGKAHKIIVLIGRDTHDTLTYGKAFTRLETPYNLSVIDSVLDIMPEEHADRSHYLNELISEPDGCLYDFVHLGHQSYLNDAEGIDRMNELYFEVHRLGALREDIRESEPVFRNSDMVVFSMNAIRQTESPGITFPSANGFTAEESCQLARFAGLSDKLSLFALAGFKPDRDVNGQTSALAAQIIWHFLQAVNQRKSDYPFSDIKQYQKYLINLPKTGYNLTFYKSPTSGRWWIEVPYPDTKYPRSLYVACSPRDYQIASDGEIPDRWWNNYRRLS